MKIFLIIYGGVMSNGGGAERRFIRAWEKLKKEGQENVILVTNRELFNSAKDLGLLDDEKQAIIYEGEYSKKDALKFSKYVASILKKNEHSIVHLVLLQRSLILLYLFLILMKKKYSIRVVTTVASCLHAYYRGLDISEKMNYKLIMRATDIVDSLYSGIKLRKKKIRITPCSFTDYERYKAGTKENIISFVGRLMPEKRPMMFLEAINEIVNQNKLIAVNEWKFYIMGGGSLEGELKKYVNDNNLERYVVFNKGDTSELFKKSKVFVAIEDFENYPSQSILEAIASENMVIATDVGDTRKIVDERYQMLIKNDISSLVDALIAIIENKVDLSKDRDLALDALKKYHNIDIFCDYLNELWDVSKWQGL